jgi:hypothetical protein
MSLFQDIFEYFLALASPGGDLPTEITEANDMVLVKCRSQPQRPALTRFPLEVAPSPDLAKAALTYSRCWEVLSRARALFEMLIRRKYSPKIS